jgi:outer membrane receptor protein involved in Fe transport
VDITDEPIVVVAPRLPEAPGEAVYDLVRIDHAAIEAADRLDQALSTIPGVSLFRRNDSGAANPTVQGLSVRAIGPSGAGRALVTLDGAPLHDPFGGWVIWGATPPELISGATIVRGAGAGPYGAGALTGVVALEERSAPGAMLRIEAGNRDAMRLGAAAIAGDDAFELLVGASAEHDDGWIPTREQRGAADARLWRDTLAGVVRLRASDGPLIASLRLSGYGEDRGSGLIGAESSAEGAAATLTLVSQPGADTRGWRVQVWTRSSDMSNAFVSVTADRSMTMPASVQYETPALGWGANAALRWHSGEVGLDIRAADGETHEFFRYIAGGFTQRRVAGGETLSMGAYVESWRRWGNVLLSGGARLDWWRASNGMRRETDTSTGASTASLTPDDRDAWAPTARAGLTRPLGALTLRAAAYAGVRPPTLNELHRPFRVGNDVTEANSALDPERLYGADIAIASEGNSTAWSLGLFAVRLNDPITNVTLGEGPGTFPPGVFVPAGGAYRQRRNAGHIDALGVEAEASGEIVNFSWRAALSVTDAEYDGGSVAPQLNRLRPAQAPRVSANANVAWRARANDTLFASLRYESTRFDDDLNSRRLDPALTLDLRYERKINELAIAFVRLDNALDAAVETGATSDGVTLYDAPRALRLGVRLNM